MKSINYFEHIIFCKPKTIFFLSKKDVKPKKRDALRRADDQFVIINTNNISFAIMMFVLSFIVLLICIPFLGDNKYVFIWPLVPFLIGFWDWSLCFFNPPRNIVLDRLNGTISYPKPYFYRKPIKIRFSELKVFQRRNEVTTRQDEVSGVLEHSQYEDI